MGKSLLPRKFRIGQIVETTSGVRAKVVGSAIYGAYHGRNGKLTLLPSAHVEYALKGIGKSRRFYRRESELRKAKK